GFTVSSPMFNSVSIRLGNGKNLTIYAKNADSDNIYIQSMKIDNASWPSLWIPWSSLENGSIVEFELVETPNLKNGTFNPPPSFYGNLPEIYDAMIRNISYIGKNDSENITRFEDDSIQCVLSDDSSWPSLWIPLSSIENGPLVEFNRTSFSYLIFAWQR
ncbi:MAG: glycoside hydrolase family 92 protein, partial [Candidatus Micrarchaeota archaeon]|nr:glycoside hydrolase family 92 protein [Candidatus Micrarchaeota archaeon]